MGEGLFQKLRKGFDHTVSLKMAVGIVYFFQIIKIKAYQGIGVLKGGKILHTAASVGETCEGIVVGKTLQLMTDIDGIVVVDTVEEVVDKQAKDEIQHPQGQIIYAGEEISFVAREPQEIVFCNLQKSKADKDDKAKKDVTVCINAGVGI